MTVTGWRPVVVNIFWINIFVCFLTYCPPLKRQRGDIKSRKSVRQSVCPTENFNRGHNFWMTQHRASIFHMCISCDKTFPSVPIFLSLWPWPPNLNYFLTWPQKHFNLGQNYRMTPHRAIIHISHVYSVWQDLSNGTDIFDLMTLTVNFDLYLENFGHIFWTVWDRAFIFTCVFLMTRSFNWYQTFDLVALTVTFDVYLENLKFVIIFKQ